MTAVQPRRRTLRTRLDARLRELDRRAGDYDRTARFREVVLGLHGRNEWPHRVMALVGRKDCGSWDVPRGRDLYVRRVYPEGPVTSLRKARPQLVTTHSATEAWEGVRAGQEWRTFDWQDDGMTLRIGYLGDDGRLHDTGLDGRDEIRLFTRWFLWDSLVKAEWFGLRRKVYYWALHNAVARRYPFTCQAVPGRDSGGYDHWHCTVRVGLRGALARRLGRPVVHPGFHRFRAMRWEDGGRVRHDSDR